MWKECGHPPVSEPTVGVHNFIPSYQDGRGMNRLFAVRSSLFALLKQSWMANSEHPRGYQFFSGNGMTMNVCGWPMGVTVSPTILPSTAR